MMNEVAGDLDGDLERAEQMTRLNSGVPDVLCNINRGL